MSCSVLGLVPVVSVDCAAPWRLQVNPELRWFHFAHPLVLLLLYNTVASLWRNQVTSASHSCGQEAESGVSGSCDVMTATSHLSEEVSGELTAEERREVWRSAHNRPDVRRLHLIPAAPAASHPHSRSTCLPAGDGAVRRRQSCPVRGPAHPEHSRGIGQLLPTSLFPQPIRSARPHSRVVGGACGRGAAPPSHLFTR